MNFNTSSSSSFSGVKVELQQLILAILDDPIVSKVFGEAGFRNTDIKMAILRPPPPILRFPKAARCPPLFLCNFPNGEEFETMNNMNMCSGDENCKRIGEIMEKSVNRNPMLVGVGACDAAKDFINAIESKSVGVLPVGISNLKYVGLGNEYVDVKKKFDELVKEERGVILGVGDLKGLLESSDDIVDSLVEEIGRVLDVHKGRFWVIGWSKTYETYMKFLSRYPTLDKDWDLQLQLITTTRPTTSRAPSLMGSFVPFGGFFPTAYESNIPVMKPHSPNPRCQHCTDMYEQELAAILKGCETSSSEDHSHSKLPSWMQNADMTRVNNTSESTKVKVDEKLLNARISELQKKWNDNCRRLHQDFQNSDANKNKALPPIIGLPLMSHASKFMNPSIINSISSPPTSEPLNKDLISKLQVDVSRNESNVNTTNELTSQACMKSITTDLVLGSPSKKSNELVQKIDEKFNISNYKAYRASFLEKVGRQDAAICAITHTIIQCKYGQERRRGASLKGDVWFNFSGQDRFGKRKAAIAMAELMFGSKENMICIDLAYQDNSISRNFICAQKENGKYDTSSRGKTVADEIAMEISKKPYCVVLLENLEKADYMVQDRLSQAIHTGKISDSYGREVSINNAIFVVTTNKVSSVENVKFCEENIIEAQKWQMKLTLSMGTDKTSSHSKSSVSISKQSPRKRKLDVFLDLNMPLEEEDENDNRSSNSDNSRNNEDQWINEFLDSMDENVKFDPFDFDSLSEYVVMEINKRFCNTFGFECHMEIDAKVMEQILAAAWVSEDIKYLNNWFDNVLLKSLIELRRNCSNKFSAWAIVQLLAMDEAYVDEFTHGVLLPSRIILD